MAPRRRGPYVRDELMTRRPSSTEPARPGHTIQVSQGIAHASRRSARLPMKRRRWFGSCLLLSPAPEIKTAWTKRAGGTNHQSTVRALTVPAHAVGVFRLRAQTSLRRAADYGTGKKMGEAAVSASTGSRWCQESALENGNQFV